MPFKSARQRRFLYANHPAMARRWSQEEKAVKKSMRYSGTSAVGRRVFGDDLSPEVVEKGLVSVSRKVSRGLGRSTDEFLRSGTSNSKRDAHYAAQTRRLKEERKIEKGLLRVSRAPRLARRAPVPPLAGRVIAGNQLTARGGAVKKSLIPAGAFKKPVSLRKPISVVAQRPASQFPGSTWNMKPAPKTMGGFPVKKRDFNPEHRRQRRLGAYQSALLLGGGLAAQRGTRGMIKTTRSARAAAELLRGKKGDVPALSRGILASRRDLAYIGGGTAALTGAEAVRHHSNSKRGAPRN